MTRLGRRNFLGRSTAGIAVPAALTVAGLSVGPLSAAQGTPANGSRARELAASRGSGLSGERLARMREALVRDVASGYVPGLVAAVSRGGDVHVEAIGTLGFEAAAPMRRDTIFRIASVTKPVTAAAAMLLVEQSVLRLDEPVDALLPELATRQVLRRLDGPLDDTVPAHRPMTLRDLLTFRLGYGVDLRTARRLPDPESDRGLRRLPRRQRWWDPAHAHARRADGGLRQAAAASSAGRGVARQLRLRHPRGADRPSQRHELWRFPAGAPLRPAWHDGYRILRPRWQARSAAHRLRA